MADGTQDPTVLFNRSLKSQLQEALKETWAPTAVRRQNYAEVYSLATTPIRSAYIPGPRSTRNAGTSLLCIDLCVTCLCGL